MDKVQLDYEKFLILFSIILSFTSGLYIFFTLVDTNLQIEIFADEKELINMAWAEEYRLKLSEEGKISLSNNEINEKNSKYVKNIYLKYNPHFRHYYQFYNKLTDDKECKNDHNKFPCNTCSNLRNIDKIRLLYNVLDGIIKFIELNKFSLFISTTFKRDLSNYHKKLSNFCKDFYNPFFTKNCLKTVNNFRNTFGEQVSYYFLWMSHLLKWTLFFSLFTIFFFYIPSFSFFKTYIANVSSRTLDFIYTITLILWSIRFFKVVATYVKNWTAFEKKYAKKWGMNESHIMEKDREKFNCDYFVLINSTRIPIKSFYLTLYKYSISFIVTLIMISITIYFLTVFQNFQSYLTDKTKELDMIFFTISEKHKSKLKSMGAWIPLIISIYIKLFSFLYEKIALSLTNNENHQKQSQFDNSYIIKTFVFGLINEYYTFYYYIFISSRWECDSNGNSCKENLIFQLRTILYTNLTINIIKEVLTPILQNLYNNYKMKKFLEFKLNKTIKSNDIRLKRYLNDNRHLICNEVKSIVSEYDQIIKIYGYVCQFGSLDPSFFILFAIFVYLQRLIDAFKMIKFYNLTAYDPNDGIGIYKKILKVFSYLSLFLNFYMVFFIKNYVKLEENKYIFYNYLLLQNMLFLIIYFLDYDFLPSCKLLFTSGFNYFSTITLDFSKNLMINSVGKQSINPSDIYNNIGVLNNNYSK